MHLWALWKPLLAIWAGLNAIDDLSLLFRFMRLGSVLIPGLSNLKPHMMCDVCDGSAQPAHNVVTAFVSTKLDGSSTKPLNQRGVRSTALSSTASAIRSSPVSHGPTC